MTEGLLPPFLQILRSVQYFSWRLFETHPRIGGKNLKADWNSDLSTRLNSSPVFSLSSAANPYYNTLAISCRTLHNWTLHFLMRCFHDSMSHSRSSCSHFVVRHTKMTIGGSTTHRPSRTQVYNSPPLLGGYDLVKALECPDSILGISYAS
jgi:hypothetical protein